MIHNKYFVIGWFWKVNMINKLNQIRLMLEKEEEHKQSADVLEFAKQVAEFQVKAIPQAEFSVEGVAQKQKRLEQETIQKLEQFQNGLERGGQLLKTVVASSQPQVWKFFIDKCTHFSAREMKELLSAMQQGITIQELCEIPGETMEVFYQVAKNLYERQAYEDAEASFMFLTVFNTKNFAFWMGRASSEYMLKKYEAAIYSYAAAALANPFDPYCHMNAAACYEALGKKEKAKKSYELALFAIEGDKNKEQLRDNITNEITRIEGR